MLEDMQDELNNTHTLDLDWHATKMTTTLCQRLVEFESQYSLVVYSNHYSEHTYVGGTRYLYAPSNVCNGILQGEWDELQLGYDYVKHKV